ncbi:IS1595 family transposase [Paenibacillus roseipurpureus]|uniref:IS1595 family transposase n=1 Tax=Paenibacillus roseopurpureus TaxID=2918901 RepID=A0AA96RJU0_9BACL|nr:IS1595 family transposase [Paenibacillus sp. MBLB1832]WNR43609.1 IS1595 family transposase [Paenibacillus sp. MBLB1832]
MDLLIFDVVEADFQTEEDCERFLVSRRWTKGFFCPGCDHDSFYEIKTRNLLECKECRAQTSITAGTIMHKSKLPLLIWFKAIRALIQDEITYTITSFADLLGVNYRTGKLLLEKLQLALQKQYGRKGFELGKESIDESVHSDSQPSRNPVLSKFRQVSRTRLRIFEQFLFKSSKNVKYHESTIFRKWMDAFLSVWLYPHFLKRFQI